MDDKALGGLNRLGDRYSSSSGPPHRSGAVAQELPHDLPERDQAELSDAVQIAFPLLRGRVLAATRRLPGAADAPESHAFHEQLPNSPAAAVRAIHGAQRWLLAAAGLSATGVEVDSAFASGFTEAVRILQEVGRWSPAVAEWFAAIELVPGLAALEGAEDPAPSPPRPAE